MITFSLPIGLMLAIALLTIVLFILDKLRQDVIAICILVVIGLLHLLPANRLFSGFANNAVISIIAVMIMSAGLEKTGIVGTIANWALDKSRGNTTRLTWLLSLIAGLFAGFMRSLGGFALLLPVINRLSLYLHTPKSRFLMPIGFCAIIGGTLTMIGSGPLIVLNGIMENTVSHHHTLHITPVGMFTVFPIGLAILIGVIIFFRYCGHHILPKGHWDNPNIGADLHQFSRIYGYGGKFHELKISHDSPIRGITLRELEQRLDGKRLAVVGISTGREILMPPLRKTRLSSTYRIAVLGKKADVEAFATEYHLHIRPQLRIFADIFNPMRSGFSEIVIPPGSDLIGKSVRDLHMRRKYHIQVLSMVRSNTLYCGEAMKALTIRSGDTLGTFSEWRYLAKVAKRQDFAVVTTEYPRERYTPKKRYHALISLFISLVLVLFAHVPAGLGLMLGALGMILTGVIDIDDAYQAVSWKTVFLLAGLIPFGLAMQATGTAEWLAQHIQHAVTLWPHWLLLLSIALTASLCSLLMTNVGATVVLVPIAIQLAIGVHADPRLFAIVTAVATSNAFLLPTHQVNALVAGPGGYKTRDFLQVGGIISIIYLLILIPAAYAFL